MDHPLSAENNSAADLISMPAAAAAAANPQAQQQQPPLLHARGDYEALNRSAVKEYVLKTYTADGGFPVVSSVISEVSSLSEDERARMRLRSISVMNSGAQITTSGGVITAPIQKGSGGLTSPTAAGAGAAAAAAAGQPKHADPGSPPSPNSAQQQGGESTGLVSMDEIVHMLETMDSELKRHWAAGDKVKALRLAIQATKMLSHAGGVPLCFPSMFVLVATVLDSLGDRVADRLEGLAVSREPIIARLLAEGKDLPFVPPEAAEICGNWFHKILSIRELLCRVTVELALLKCFKYVGGDGAKSHVPVKSVIVRLGNQIRGVANAQVASHLRWYLFMRSREELARGRNPGSWAHCLAQCALDNLDMMARMVLPPSCAGSQDAAAAYVGTFSPSMRWMFDTIVRFGGSAAGPFVQEALRMITECAQLQFGSVVIVFLMCAPPEFLFKNFDLVWEALIENSAVVFSPGYSKLRAIGELMAALADPASGVAAKLSKSKRAQMLNLLFGAIAENAAAGTVSAHFQALTAALQFTARLMPFAAVGTVLGEVRSLVLAVEQQHKSGGGGAASSSASTSSGLAGGSDFTLQQVEDSVSTIIRWVVELTSPDSYIPCAAFTNLLLTTASLSSERRQQLTEHVLVEAAKGITVPSVAQAAFELCRVLHDALPPTASAADVAAAEAVVSRIVAATYSPTAVPESLLRFYSECRHVLSRFGGIRKMILYEALRLVGSVPRSQIQKRRQQLRPCLAFVHATCPSVGSPVERARVAADAACVAYERGFVAQGEALMETALTSMQAFPAGRGPQGDAEAARVALHLVHVGVVMPPPSSDAHLFAVAAVLKWAADFAWTDATQAAKLAATTLSLLARAKAGAFFANESGSSNGSSSGGENKKGDAALPESVSKSGGGGGDAGASQLYRFSSLQHVALHKLPEYQAQCETLQLRALRLCKANMPCNESGDAIDVAEILLGAFVAARGDAATHIALHWAVAPLMCGQYANAESQYEAFRASKNALLATLQAEAGEDPAVLAGIKNGTGLAQFDEYEKKHEQAEEEEGL